MTNSTQAKKASLLLKLHQGPRILVFPNVWDVASAKLVERAGFPAVATSSAAIAFALGYPDGQRIRREEMLAVVARIAAGVSVPVTADLEAGYGGSLEDIAITANGSAPFTYLWRTNTVRLTNSTHYAGVTTATLNITNVTRSDALTYTGQITNSAGNGSAVGVLTVLVPPPTLTNVVLTGGNVVLTFGSG